jgi:hypothetical protein
MPIWPLILLRRGVSLYCVVPTLRILILQLLVSFRMTSYHIWYGVCSINKCAIAEIPLFFHNFNSLGFSTKTLTIHLYLLFCLGSVTVSLRVTFAESGSKCNAVDIGREMSLICNVAFIVSEDSTAA